MHRQILIALLRQDRRNLAVAYAHYVVAKRGLFYHGTSSVFAIDCSRIPSRLHGFGTATACPAANTQRAAEAVI